MAKKYTTVDVLNALKEIEEGSTILRAAKKYGIPRSTLSEKKSGRHPIETRMGPATVLTQEEETLFEKWILHMLDSGFPVSKYQLLDSVQRLLNDMKRDTIFKENRPGRKWYKAFLKRHPIIRERESQNLTHARASVTEKNIRDWFDAVLNFLKKQNLDDILEDPTRIMNMDESAFYLSPEPGKVLARRGEKHVYSKIKDNDKECITTLIGASADGTKIPPMVLFNYKRLPSHILRQFPDTWAYGRSTKGWMTCETFYEYIANCLCPWLVESKVKFPVVVFLDGHASHISYHLSQFCSEKGIILIALYPNATHIIQPMDVSVFRPMKLHWLHRVRDWRLEFNGAKLSRELFAPILADVLDKFISVDIIKNGFRKCGLYPFDQNAINYEDLIKKPKEIQNDNASEPVLRSEFLDLIEEKIGAEKLQSFKLSGPNWCGSIYDVNLFQFWKDNGGICSGGTDSHQNTDIVFEFIDSVEVQSTGEVEPSTILIHPVTISSNSLDCDDSNSNTIITTQNDSLPVHSLLNHQSNSTIIPSDSYVPIFAPTLNSNQTADVVCNDVSPVPLITSNSYKIGSKVASNIPSTFNDVNFWPGTPSEMAENPNQKKIPFACMSKKFNSYLDEVDTEKQKIETKKSERKKLREKKKQITDPTVVHASKTDKSNTPIAAPIVISNLASTSSISESSIEYDIPIGVPEIFKRALPWPKKAVKRAAAKPKPKKTAFLTSNEFITTLKEAENKKLKLQEDKMDRKTQRELKASEKKS